MSGLARRRVNAAAEGGASIPTAPLRAGSAPPGEANGRRIAFDPRDLHNDTESSAHPRLTIMEEVLLLGLKDKQGYLSFWNDSISYALRGCIIMELAFRGRIAMQQDPQRKRFALADRCIELVDDRLTGEMLLDEAMKMIKSSEQMSVGQWVDLMSGETWNLMKIGYQLKQVRERLAKGLVDKGILRTEKRNFLLFDMATHPVTDNVAKSQILRRVMAVLSQRGSILPSSPLFPENVQFRCVRTIAMVCAAYAANVLENSLNSMDHDARDHAFARVDELLGDFSQWPFRVQSSVCVGNMPQLIAEEMADKNHELKLEVVAAVLQVFTRLDNIL